MTEYLTILEVLIIHQDQIERYGGTHGIRDRGLLDAALSRPQSGHYVNLIEEAAALWESLAQNHPFIDGNKRVAFATAYTFLAINGVRIIAGEEEVFDFINNLYQINSFKFESLVAWLKNNTLSSL